MAPIDKKNIKIVLTGAGGFLGSHFADKLRQSGYQNVVGISKKQYDLREQSRVRALLETEKPDWVVHMAGLVGGILANKEKPADYFYENLVMGTLMHHESWNAGVKKFMGVIGGCSYPAKAPSPINEDALWEGYPQAESAAYSTAKKMLVVQSQAYRKQYDFNSIVLVPGNLYGPRDNFSLTQSHVIPALIRKAVEARDSKAESITMWGSGKPTRDFVYVEDVASVLVHALETYDASDIINISSGQEITIRELTELVMGLVGFKGEIVWDASKPDGQMRKQFDVTRMKSVLKANCPTSLKDGLKKTIEWFEKNRALAA